MKTEQFSHRLLDGLDLFAVPNHIAIIPDGNRRWAAESGLHPFQGHSRGAEVLTDTVRAAKDLGVKTITFYSFSTENWERPKDEVAALMSLLVYMLESERADMVKDGVRFHTIGDLTPFSDPVLESISETKEATAHCSAINLVLALNYGGRDEIRRVFKQLLDEGKRSEEITEELISSRLDTAPFGDPELVIRTSGELRVSNFMLWQLSYAELLPLPIFWPEFEPDHLLEAIVHFQQRQRRLGR